MNDTSSRTRVVTRRAIEARLRRRLARDGRLLRRWGVPSHYGYDVVEVVGSGDLEFLARRAGVLRDEVLLDA